MSTYPVNLCCDPSLARLYLNDDAKKELHTLFGEWIEGLTAGIESLRSKLAKLDKRTKSLELAQLKFENSKYDLLLTLEVLENIVEEYDRGSNLTAGRLYPHIVPSLAPLVSVEFEYATYGCSPRPESYRSPDTDSQQSPVSNHADPQFDGQVE